MLNLNNVDPMGLVLFTLPLLIFAISIAMQFIFKKRLVILFITFVCCLISTFTIFNSSFLIYCFIYTFISLLGTFICDLVLRIKNNFIRKRK
ncbi:YbeF family protein [Clostridium frigoris]|uniref:YbeF family protein n=1 Tax=Clostridium frigoris TaxID=205327 RepID=A0ABS6BUJ6_9CLOT|nr:YbeF family protein [Clostridium frigoris]